MTTYVKLWLELLGLSLRRQRAYTVATLVAVLCSVLVVAVSALALREAVNSIVRGDTADALTAALVAAFVYALNLVLQDTAGILRVTTNDRLGRLDLHPRVHLDLARTEGLDHLERTDFLDRVSIVRSGTSHITMSMWNAVMAVSNVLKLVITVLLLGTVSPWLGLLLLFAAVPVWCDHRGQSIVKRVEVETSEAYRLHQHLSELAVGASGGKELRVSGAGSEVVDRQAQAWRDAMGPRSRAQFAAAAWKLTGWLVFTAGFIGALALITYRTAHGHGTVGDLVLTVTIAASLRQTVAGTVQSTTATAGSRRVLEPYLWLRSHLGEEAARSQGSAQPPARLTDGIALHDVSYTYPGTDRRAVDAVTTTLPAGSVVAVVGEYGSGKTTLVKLLNKFYRADEGSITVDGQELSALDTEAWRARSTAAFQDFGRFHTTFARAVGLGDLPRVEDRASILRAIRETDSESLLDRLPDGLDTQLGRELGGVDLSEGQWQRTALARAAMRTGPLLFVLDEPTASLDAPSEQAIFEQQMARARELGRVTGAVTVVVSHRFSTVTGADKILVMHEGSLVESGDHDELMRLGGRYADLYGIQAAAYAD